MPPKYTSPIIVTCAFCQGQFAVSRPSARRKYCTHKCSTDANIRRVERTCKHCGVVFPAMRWTIVDGAGHYCSRRCRSDARRTLVERACAWCGAPFMARPSALQKGNARFCGRVCGRRAGDAKRPRRTTAERFLASILKTDTCWLWLKSRDASGYGVMQAVGGQGNTRRAHRVSWEMAHGPIPDGLFVLHRCDNRPCVRPDHLWVGTHQENMADMARKGRNRKTWRHVD